MKVFLICLALCTAFCMNALGQKKEILDGQVQFESSNSVGTITITSSGFGKKKPMAAANAAASAIYVLLFRGMPGSQYELPMIGDENKVNDPVVQNLLDGGYSSFITENSLISEQKQTRKTDGAKGYYDLYRMTINCDALRRHLEQNKVIRKFGI